LDTIGEFHDPGIQKLSLDVASDDAVRRVVQVIMEREGRIDVVVNNAGLICPGVDTSCSELESGFHFAFILVSLGPYRPIN